MTTMNKKSVPVVLCDIERALCLLEYLVTVNPVEN